MTDLELAEEIERQLWNDGLRIPVEELYDSSPHAAVHRRVNFAALSWKQIIAALRRGPERIDAKMAELLVDTTWRKAVGQCVTDICGLDGNPLGKSCDRLFISRERFDEHIAPLLRERPPSGEMVMVPREPTKDRA